MREGHPGPCHEVSSGIGRKHGGKGEIGSIQDRDEVNSRKDGEAVIKGEGGASRTLPETRSTVGRKERVEPGSWNQF